MEEIEIPLYEEIGDYKEKIGIMTFRQWVFSALICLVNIPLYIFGRKFIPEDIVDFIIIFVAGILGFIGFVKIHELSAEKIIPFWYRHYTLFAKPIKYITEAEYKELQNKKGKEKKKKTENENKAEKFNSKSQKRISKEEKILEKAKKKYENKLKKDKNKEKRRSSNKDITDNNQLVNVWNDSKENKKVKEDRSEELLNEKFNSLSLEEKQVLLKLLMPIGSLEGGEGRSAKTGK